MALTPEYPYLVQESNDIDLGYRQRRIYMQENIENASSISQLECAYIRQNTPSI